MSNHLGNVLAVISDKKLPIDLNQDTLVDYYLPEVFSTSDYSPFGVILDGRNFNSEKFRMSFQNQERDTEIFKGGSYNFTFRMHRPDVGRFFGVDPLLPQYPELTPYQFASATPIWARELEGLEASYSTTKNDDGSTLITITYDYQVKKSSKYVSNFSVFKAAINIKLEMQKSMKAYDSETNTYYETKVNLDFKSNPVQGENFYLDFVDKVTHRKNGVNYTSSSVGRVDEIGNTKINRVQILLEKDGTKNNPDANLQTTKELSRTGMHESGHVGGLYHPGERDINNIEVEEGNFMYQSSSGGGFDVNLEQMKKIVETIDNNNNEK